MKKLKSAADDPRVEHALSLADLPALLAMSGPGELVTELIRLEDDDWFEAVGEAPAIAADVEMPSLDKEMSSFFQ